MEKTIKLHDGSKIEISNVYADSPREWTNISTMIFFGRYSHLGDDHDFNADDYDGWDEMENAIRNKLNVKHIQKVYGYSHGGLAISLEPFSCRWDSGVLGFAVITAENVTECMGGKYATRKNVEKAIHQIKDEIKVLDQYVNGDVWGFTIKDKEGDIVDSCGGFFGSDFKSNGMLDYMPEDLHEEILVKLN